MLILYMRSGLYVCIYSVYIYVYIRKCSNCYVFLNKHSHMQVFLHG